MPRPRGIGHVHLKVTDLERAVAFYTELVGLEVSERVGDGFAFLTAGERHHDLALQRVGAQARRPGPGSTGLYHTAFELADESDLRAAARRLAAAGIDSSAIDHGISRAVYFHDPDGHGVELYVDTRHRRSLWEGRSLPLRLEPDPLDEG